MAKRKVTISVAAAQMLSRIADCERDGGMLPSRRIDFRAYPKLAKEGLVACNIYSSGVCFTPKGRAFWHAREHT